MANNLKHELHALMDDHAKRKAEEARLAKQTQERLEAAKWKEARNNAEETELPHVLQIMRSTAMCGQDKCEYDFGLIAKDTYTDMRADLIEGNLRAQGIFKITRKHKQMRARHLDDIYTHLVMEIGW